MSLRTAYKELLAKWPLDKARPAEKNLRNAIDDAVRIAFGEGTTATAATAQSTKPTTVGLVANAASKEITSPLALEALNKILNNEYKNRYPVSSKVLQPAMNPHHYENILKEVDKVAKGEKSSIVAKMFGGKA